MAVLSGRDRVGIPVQMQVQVRRARGDAAALSGWVEIARVYSSRASFMLPPRKYRSASAKAGLQVVRAEFESDFIGGKRVSKRTRSRFMLPIRSWITLRCCRSAAGSGGPSRRLAVLKCAEGGIILRRLHVDFRQRITDFSGVRKRRIPCCITVSDSATRSTRNNPWAIPAYRSSRSGVCVKAWSNSRKAFSSSESLK